MSAERQYPYTPRRGDAVKDDKGTVWKVMDRAGSRVQCRPLAGGVERDIDASKLAPATRADVLQAQVQLENRRSRGEI